MKKLLVLLLVACLVAVGGCGTALTVCGTVLTVASQAGALSGVKQMGAVNAKQVRAVNAAHKVAGQPSALGVASGMIPALIK